MTHIHMQTKAWEKGYLKARRSLEERKKRIEKFTLNKSCKILDLGCGDGLNISILRTMGMTNLVGIDPSKYLVEEARTKNPKTKFYIGSAESLPFKNDAFDVIFVDSVFHHILDFNRAIKEIKRVLKSNGTLCFIEPHRSILRSIFDFITISPIGKFLPHIKHRRVTYMEEKPLMEHWLKTEYDFYNFLEKNNFKKIFHQYELLSVLGKYKNVAK